MRDRPGQVDLEPLGEPGEPRIGRIADCVTRRLPPQRAQETHQLLSRHVLVQPQLARQVRDMPACGGAIVPAFLVIGTSLLFQGERYGRTPAYAILLNLLSNAVKFTHQGGVWVTVSKDEEDLRFDVRDTGIGIRKEDLDSIWEDFRQVDQSRTREFGGTGLGLSITRKLVDALGGHVFAQSTFGRGSTFTVVLPIRSIHRPHEAPRVVDDVPPPSPAKR